MTTGSAVSVSAKMPCRCARAPGTRWYACLPFAHPRPGRCALANLIRSSAYGHNTRLAHAEYLLPVRRPGRIHTELSTYPLPLLIDPRWWAQSCTTRGHLSTSFYTTDFPLKPSNLDPSRARAHTHVRLLVPAAAQYSAADRQTRPSIPPFSLKLAISACGTVSSRARGGA